MPNEKIASAHVDNASHKLVVKVAEKEGVDPLKLSPPLYEVIDPDALDQLFASTPTAGRKEGQVTFSYNGYEVTVCGDGYVSVQ
ncbi:hypothetical protein OB919_18805 [Halobacteria archaeon AArc-curdl1]|uniref:Halobacterial output domain-containing protein n=1 Tax=Natronosalvus hydrolyticus TaxID=2979988 RepID=A0AAP3E7K8_9EURY|nr:hypothetical protein [Halobacteria archaeon AArc-curdl1]